VGSGMCAPSASGVRALRIVYRRPCVQCFGVQSRVWRVRIGCVPGRLEVSVCVCVNIGRLNERGSESAAFIVVSARKKTLRAMPKSYSQDRTHAYKNAISVLRMLPDLFPRAAALSAIRNSGVLLHTYAIPWHAMNTTSSVRNLYQLMMVQGDRDEDSYAGATRAVINQLPHAIPNAAAANYDNRTMFILPLSPWHLCFASVLLDPLAMSLKQPHVSAKLSQNLQSRWKNRSQLPPVEEIMGFVKYGSRTCMRTSRVWPRSNHTFPFTCRAFEAAVQWTVDQHTWAEAPERHVWMFEWPHYLRAALAAERHATGGAQSLQGKMALGLLLTQ